MINQECKVKLKLIDVNSIESLFFPYSVKISKCGGSCDNINDPYSKLCVWDVLKNVNVKVFSLMSRTYETKHVKFMACIKLANVNVWLRIYLKS